MTVKPAAGGALVVPPYQPPTAAQRALVRQLRAERRQQQEPERCKKHPTAPSRLFAVQEPGRRTRHVWLCIECASVLVGMHGATLRRP